MKPPGSESEPAIPTVRFKLVVAYDGTEYAGWQVQKSGVAVQEKVDAAMQRLFPGVGRIHSSSRTDTGVHALGMVAHVDLPREQVRMSPDKLALALNAHLPEDVRVMAVSRCRSDFHARFSATGKQYRYFVWNHPAHQPLLRRHAWHVPRKLDLGAMRSASRLFLGTHDFASLAANRNYQVENTVRTLRRCDVRRGGSLLTFVIEGDGFLYKMCRGIVGTLVQVGVGKFSANEIPAILRSRDRRVAGMTAPAHGLVLWKVFYDRHPERNEAPAGAGAEPSGGDDLRLPIE